MCSIRYIPYSHQYRTAGHRKGKLASTLGNVSCILNVWPSSAHRHPLEAANPIGGVRGETPFSQLTGYLPKFSFAICSIALGRGWHFRKLFSSHVHRKARPIRDPVGKIDLQI